MKIIKCIESVALAIFIIVLLAESILPLILINFKIAFPLNSTLLSIQRHTLLRNLTDILCPYPLVVNGSLCEFPNIDSNIARKAISLTLSGICILYGILGIVVWLTRKSLWKNVFIGLIIMLIISLCISVYFVVLSFNDVITSHPGADHTLATILGILFHYSILALYFWLVLHLFHVIFILLYPFEPSWLGAIFIILVKSLISGLLPLAFPLIAVFGYNGYQFMINIPLPRDFVVLFWLFIFPISGLNFLVIILTFCVVIIVWNLTCSADTHGRYRYRSLVMYTAFMLIVFSLGTSLISFINSIIIIVSNHSWVFSPESPYFIHMTLLYNSYDYRESFFKSEYSIFSGSAVLAVLFTAIFPSILYPTAAQCFILALSGTTVCKILKIWFKPCCIYFCYVINPKESQTTNNSRVTDLQNRPNNIMRTEDSTHVC